MTVSAVQVLRSLGKSKAIELLVVLNESNEGQGFNELKKQVGTDAKTLTRRLDELGDLGITKKRDDGMYCITPAGNRSLGLAFEIEETVCSSEDAEIVR